MIGFYFCSIKLVVNVWAKKVYHCECYLVLRIDESIWDGCIKVDMKNDINTVCYLEGYKL